MILLLLVRHEATLPPQGGLRGGRVETMMVIRFGLMRPKRSLMRFARLSSQILIDQSNECF
ncbi:hypothetical protein ADU59_25190 [Pararhizobium polonicum]|uniref:Uncharacterized protein n=1 Tax=Pararhizobium polonicum TaxID=1612624 RepID=A0A1C7NVG9_9HYPH|nr:hypothetical protein ADU59_25190 [Pararhizobium polonicum]